MVRLVHDSSTCALLFQYSLCRVVLMVCPAAIRNTDQNTFQYSLCRVVLMVPVKTSDGKHGYMFQYSLCRVVLMVLSCSISSGVRAGLSVLALSSRFDGPISQRRNMRYDFTFSTRSVESF